MFIYVAIFFALTKGWSRLGYISICANIFLYAKSIKKCPSLTNPLGTRPSIDWDKTRNILLVLFESPGIRLFVWHRDMENSGYRTLHVKLPKTLWHCGPAVLITCATNPKLTPDGKPITFQPNDSVARLFDFVWGGCSRPDVRDSSLIFLKGLIFLLGNPSERPFPNVLWHCTECHSMFTSLCFQSQRQSNGCIRKDSYWSFSR